MMQENVEIGLGGVACCSVVRRDRVGGAAMARMAKDVAIGAGRGGLLCCGGERG